MNRSPYSLSKGNAVLWGIAFVLLVTGALKLYDSSGSIKALDEPHPLLLLSYRQVESFAGLTEIGLALWCLLSAGSVRSLGAVFGFSWCLLCYKAVHWYADTGEPCRCLGVLLGWWPALKEIEEPLTWTLALLLAVSSGLRLRRVSLSLPGNETAKAGTP